jgi:hypothetical protein
MLRWITARVGADALKRNKDLAFTRTPLPRSGRGGRRFKSCHSDQYLTKFFFRSGTTSGTDTPIAVVFRHYPYGSTPKWRGNVSDPASAATCPPSLVRVINDRREMPICH